MSQAKVDYKKEQRKNIKKTVRKRKVSHVLAMVAFAVVACGMIGWLVFSGYQTYTEAKSNGAVAAEEIPVDLDAISDYISDMTPVEETAEEVSEENVEENVEETDEDSSDESAENETSEEEETAETEASDGE